MDIDKFTSKPEEAASAFEVFIDVLKQGNLILDDPFMIRNNFEPDLSTFATSQRGWIYDDNNRNHCHVSENCMQEWAHQYVTPS